MKTTRTPANTSRIHFHDQADKAAEIARLDSLIAWWSDPKRTKRYGKAVRRAIARRRKVSGYVVGV